MEQIMKNLEDPEVRRQLLEEFVKENAEQAEFKKQLRFREKLEPMFNAEHKGTRSRNHGPVARKSVCAAFRGR